MRSMQVAFLPEGMMREQLRDWLVRQGFPEEIELMEMRRGLGSTELWSFLAAPQIRMVVRLFADGMHAPAEREAMAMQAAASHGLPVPPIIARGTIGDRPVLVTTFATGELARELLAMQPDRAHAIGLAMGETLGRLHEIRVPVTLRAASGGWIAKGGPALAPIRTLLESVPNQDRLIHLDYHPNNVFIEGDRVTAIIDWENALAGPPHIDLARSRAILRAVVASDGIPAGHREAIATLEQGLVEGHARVAGSDPHPELSAAWGLAMTIDDLSAQMGKPGMLISPDAIDRLAEERDSIVAALAGS